MGHNSKQDGLTEKESLAELKFKQLDTFSQMGKDLAHSF